MIKEVYRDERYVLGQADGEPFVSIDGREYRLSCHPYEPCLYVKSPDGVMTAVHNAFDPSYVLEAFSDGKTVTSITGMEYDAEDFCRMVEYAAGGIDLQIDGAEKVFGDKAKKKNQQPERKTEEKQPAGGPLLRPASGGIIEDDPFYDLIAGYPDCAVDYVLVKAGKDEKGFDAHRTALLWACIGLFGEEEDENSWKYDIAKAVPKQISAEELFFLPEGLHMGTENRPVTGQKLVTDGGKRPYWQAFLAPPYGGPYTAEDFRKVNAALFPNGTDKLDVCEWTTGWSDYFDDGREWWGTLCVTVYDPDLDRFAVLMASATD